MRAVVSSRVRHRRSLWLLLSLALTAAVVAASCSSGSGGAGSSDAATSTTSAGADESGTSAPTTSPSPSAPESVDTGAIGKYPERVYVPNSEANTVTVIDPATYEIVDVYPAGELPHHISPNWDLTELYVYNTVGNSLTVIDPESGKATGEIPVEDPYNLYFTPDGTKAIVVAERLRRLDFRDPETWELIKSVPIDPEGVDHLAFSQDGSYLVAGTEFSGFLAKVDVDTMELISLTEVGGAPIDVVRAPDSDVMFVANQDLNGVHVVDTEAMTEETFIPTGKGTHGILMSRDKKSLYASNRLDGTISVIDIDTRKVVDTWDLGEASPDMGMLNPDGTVMWITGRYHNEVYALDTSTGELLARIPVAAGPHGLTYFPTQGVRSIGHNGVTIDHVPEPRTGSG